MGNESKHQSTHCHVLIHLHDVSYPSLPSTSYCAGTCPCSWHQGWHVASLTYFAFQTHPVKSLLLLPAKVYENQKHNQYTILQLFT